MKHIPWLVFFVFICFISLNSFAQSQDDYFPLDDSDAAQKYIDWINKAISERSVIEIQNAYKRALDYADVSSDISYKLAVLECDLSGSRKDAVNHLNKAIETNRWKIHNENEAMLLKAQQLIAMRHYFDAVACLDKIVPKGDQAGNAQIRADAAMLRLMALRAMLAGYIAGADPAQFLAQFRSEVLLAMDRFPRDPRPLRIFFEYAHNRRPAASEMPPGDLELLELALRRLPFLLEADPNLAWMAAPYIYDLEYARRLTGAYRAASMQPNKGSIPIALNLGLIDDNTAIEELFFIAEGDMPDFNKEVVVNTYKLLRSEEGRELFTQKLHSLSGRIYNDTDNDGYFDSFISYHSGELEIFTIDTDQDNYFELIINMKDGVPDFAQISQQDSRFLIYWERYPSVQTVLIEKRLTDTKDEYTEKFESEQFTFGPASFLYAPVKFSEIGGSQKTSGLFYPEPAFQYMELTRKALISSCSSITRPSSEIENAQETIYMNRGVILQVVETLNEKQVSVTEFERGLPVIQHIDLDLDGRMETIRRFRRPPQNYVWQDLLDYRRLVASSESDWSGDGKHKTREVYQLDGSVVYSFDMDGSGEMNYSETGNR